MEELMRGYIIRRCLQSILVIAGVLLLTFLLFRVAAGDPARAVLGKNPSPKEVEEMRLSLSSSKPLFWGHWRTTEIFSSANFADGGLPRGVRVDGDAVSTEDGLAMSDGGKVSFIRNFSAPDVKLRVELFFKGDVAISALDRSGKEILRENRASRSFGTVVLTFGEGELPAKIAVTSNSRAILERVSFKRRQKSAFDSQFLAAASELVSFTSEFPYVRFMNFGRTLITREPVSVVLWRGGFHRCR
jgi:hypothetical protein